MVSISPFLTTESPVPQWSEYPTRSWRVVGSNPNWNLVLFNICYITHFGVWLLLIALLFSQFINFPV